ncbi:hypothetical protein [Leptospira interrogans]|uniref:hypothetical protein n=1 Tax=Leptospira interrogans TaxID=173 RepID=UPI0002BA0D5A|nr:hypothetical protein [Leptospira interrogans]KGE21803.1 hypothetical protein IQ65_21960 [Leptospira interrogans serovar Lai]MBM2890046.1 hypothetical protein [Leptospira interrogans]QOI36831.1 hypothetical protein LeptoLang_21780 [Leptospira interrogans serovar Icterohaemorrhagiae]
MKTLEEGLYTKSIIYDFESRKSVLIEITYFYPIGESVIFRVSNFLFQKLLRGRIRKDGVIKFVSFKAIETLSTSEGRELAWKIYEEVDKVLELPDDSFPPENFKETQPHTEN